MKVKCCKSFNYWLKFYPKSFSIDYDKELYKYSLCMNIKIAEYNNIGIQILYCPSCGKKINVKKEDYISKK